jgi:hypothetical protein
MGLGVLVAVLAGCSGAETTAPPATSRSVQPPETPPSAAVAGRLADEDEKAPLGAGMAPVMIWRRDSKLVDAAAPMLPDDAGVARATDAGSKMSAEDARVADAATMEEPTEPAPPALPAPVHRYDFAGDDERVLDRVGSAHGTARHGAMQQDGAIRLDGADDFVELPSGPLSDLSDLTILVWLSWEGGECWQRVFDFGQAFPRSDGAVTVASSLFLTPRACPSNFPAVGHVSSAGNEHIVSDAQLVSTSKLQLGVTFDSTARVLRLIVNGQTIAEQRTALQLQTLRAADSWIGRSHFANDPGLRGRIDELRIYASALDQDTLSKLYEGGPDAP